VVRPWRIFFAFYSTKDSSNYAHHGLSIGQVKHIELTAHYNGKYYFLISTVRENLTLTDYYIRTRGGQRINIRFLLNRRRRLTNRAGRDRPKSS
jgi:hypothetical protein